MKPLRKITSILLLCLGLAASGSAPVFGDWQPPTQSESGPQNPVQKQYAGGKVTVIVHAPRHYGYRLGEPISLEVVVISAPDVKINVDAIMRGVLSPTGSDFELVAPPTQTQTQQDGRNITQIQLKVRTWVTVDKWGAAKNNIVFNAAFLYATDTLPDGKPNWFPVNTPDFVVTTSNTATESSKDLLPGDTEQKPFPYPTLVIPLRVAGATLLLIPLFWLMFTVYRLVNPPRQPPANELAWKVFARLLEESNGAGFSYENTQLVAHTLRSYLQVESSPLSEVELGLEKFFAHLGNEELYTHVRVAQEALSILDRALYERPDGTKPALSPQDTRELFARIDQVVPRP